jgi:hydroxypyruvate isomerase
VPPREEYDMSRGFTISLCIEPLFPDLPFADRIGKAAALGFRTIEFWDPANKDLGAIREACDAAGVTVSDCCFAESWGSSRLHAETDRVVATFKKTVPMLKQVGTRKAIVLTGETESGKSPAAQRARVVENLEALGPIAAREGVTILLEALNSLVDHKGYFLDSARAGFDIIREVGHPNVRLLFDVYHMQIMEGNIIDSVTRNIDLIGHFHAAGVPGRHELDTGELDYRRILEAIDKAGYRGAFGLEYWPTMDHAESLRRTAEYLGLERRG